jgi:hypothetical protein
MHSNRAMLSSPFVPFSVSCKNLFVAKQVMLTRCRFFVCTIFVDVSDLTNMVQYLRAVLQHSAGYIVRSNVPAWNTVAGFADFANGMPLGVRSHHLHRMFAHTDGPKHYWFLFTELVLGQRSAARNNVSSSNETVLQQRRTSIGVFLRHKCVECQQLRCLT